MNEKLRKSYWRKARLIARILSLVPFIRMIAVTGSLARGKITKKSDIDFFIVTCRGRIWTSRAFVVGILKLLGQYRTGQKIAGKICPNRFSIINYLTIHPQNLYHAIDYSRAVPLLDINQTYQKYLMVNKWWKQKIKNQKSKIKITNQNSKIIINQQLFLTKIFEKVLADKIGDLLEKKLKLLQLKSIMADPRTHQKDSGVFVSDKELRFHPIKRA